MAVNEDLSAYSTVAASNTPDGNTNIGTDLDDHLRDIKRNIKRAGTHFARSTAPEQVTGIVWYDTSGTSSNRITDIKLWDDGWINLFRVNQTADVAYALADPTLYPTAQTTLTAGSGLSGGGTLAASRSFSVASTGLTATTTYTVSTVVLDPFGRVVSAADGPGIATKAQMQDRSSTAVYVTPVRMKDHLGVAKFWVSFQAELTASITNSYNVDSVVRSATGVYTINFNTGFADTGYVVIATCDDESSASVFRVVNSRERDTGSCHIIAHAEDGSLNDPNNIHVVGFGFHSTA